MFVRSTATGTCARSATVPPPNSDEEREIQHTLEANAFPSQSSVRGLYRDNASSPCAGPTKSSGKRKSNAISVDSGDGSVKKSTRSSTVEMLTNLWAAKQLDKEEKKKSTVHRSVDPFSVSKCMEILTGMHLEPTLFYRAIHVFDNPNMREAFITMPHDLRYGFLTSFQ